MKGIRRDMPFNQISVFLTLARGGLLVAGSHYFCRISDVMYDILAISLTFSKRVHD